MGKKGPNQTIWIITYKVCDGITRYKSLFSITNYVSHQTVPSNSEAYNGELK